MASQTTPGPGKRAFVENFLKENPEANEREVNDAWQAAGNSGTIGGTTFYKVKRQVVGTGTKSRAARRKPSTTGKRPVGRPRKITPSTEARPRSQSTLEELEADCDRLLFKVMSHDLPEIEEQIREVRRMLVRQHQG